MQELLAFTPKDYWVVFFFCLRVARGLFDDYDEAAQRIQAVVLDDKTAISLLIRTLELNITDVGSCRPRNQRHPRRNATLSKFHAHRCAICELQHIVAGGERRDERQCVRTRRKINGRAVLHFASMETVVRGRLERAMDLQQGCPCIDIAIIQRLVASDI